MCNINLVNPKTNNNIEKICMYFAEQYNMNPNYDKGNYNILIDNQTLLNIHSYSTIPGVFYTVCLSKERLLAKDSNVLSLAFFPQSLVD